MTIKKIYLQINDDSKMYSFNSDFSFETYFITEYISRDIFKKKYKYEKANKLIIYIDSKEKTVKYSDVFKVLECFMVISYSDIIKLDKEERTEKILNIIEKAAWNCDKTIHGIGSSTQDSIHCFREGGYKNTWLFQKKKINKVWNAKLICELNRKNFTLNFVVENKIGEIYKREIIKEMPDSLCYHHKFRTLVIVDDRIAVIDRFDKPIFQIPITEIG